MVTSTPTEEIGFSTDIDSKKNFGRRCAKASLRTLAKMLSLMADERHVSLFALIDVPVPSPNHGQHVVGKPPQVYCVVGHRRQGK